MGRRRGSDVVGEFGVAALAEDVAELVAIRGAAMPANTEQIGPSKSSNSAWVLVRMWRKRLGVVDGLGHGLNSVERAFRAAKVKRAKQVDGIHALRHFYASTLLAQGVSIKKLAIYLGHADPGSLCASTPKSSRRATSAPGWAVGTVTGRPGAEDGLEAA